MRNFKKILSLVLCMAMMLSVMVVGAGAAFKDDAQIQHDEAVDMCVALNIVNGYTDGSFKPEGNITRAEMCKMICIALNGGKEPATATKAVPTYTDIDGHWAEGYIEYCNTKGIVAGIGGGKFNPNGNVTGSEAAKMLLVALGYNATVEKYVGASWELYVNVQANQDGLYEDLETMDPSVALTRDNAAQMIWNAMQTMTITKTSSIDRVTGAIIDTYEKNGSDLLDKMYKGEIEEEVLNGFSYDSNKAVWTYSVGEVQVKSSVNYTDLLGQKVKAVYDNGTTGTVKNAYGIFATDSEIVLTSIVGELPKMTNNTDTSFKVDNVTYKLDKASSGTQMTLATLPVYQFTSSFGTLYTAGNLYDLAGGTTVTYDAQEFTAVDQDGNGKIDFLMIVPFTVAKVTYVNSDKFNLGYASTTLIKNSYEFDDVDAYEGLAKDDHVIVVAAANTATGVASVEKAETISGKVVERDKLDISIDGTWYTTDASYKADDKAAAAPAVDTTLTDAVVVNGYLFAASEKGFSNVEDYVVVVDSDLTAAYTPTVKLMFSDGTKKIVEVDLDAISGIIGTGRDGAYQASDLEGKLFVYDTNKDGEYELTYANTKVAPTNNTGFDYAAVSGTVKAKNSTASKAALIDNYAIADDAVIFVQYATDSYKVISGATMKTMAKNQFTTVHFVLATDNAKTGGGDVNMAYVTSSATTIKNSDTFYGYVTGLTEGTNEDGKGVWKVTLWTENGTKTLNTVDKTSKFDVLDTGYAVKYTVDGDNAIDDVIWAAPVATSSWNGAHGYQTGAITFWDGSYMIIDDNGNRWEVTDDTVCLFVDNDNTAGVEAGEIAVADKNEKGDAYINNAFIVVDTTENEVLFVVYEADNQF